MVTTLVGVEVLDKEDFGIWVLRRDPISLKLQSELSVRTNLRIREATKVPP